MSSASGTKKKVVNSTEPGDRGSHSHRESAINAGQYQSNDTHSHSKKKPPPPPPLPDQRRRDEGQACDTKSQGQRRPSMSSPEDGTNRLSPADHPRRDDYGQLGADVGYGGSSRHSKDGYNGRSRPKEGRISTAMRLIWF